MKNNVEYDVRDLRDEEPAQKSESDCALLRLSTVTARTTTELELLTFKR